MTWLTERRPNHSELAAAFSRAMTQPGILKLPGVHDALTGLIARRVGFSALYLSGAAYTASRGLPDVGLVGAAEVAERASDIVRATGLPLLADIDTGYGGPLQAARAAKEMADAGVAALQIEDQVMPKRCGHLQGKKLVSPQEMCEKIRMIKKVTPDMVVVARTDARGVTGLEDAIARARLYLACGADAIFPEALENAAEFQAVAGAVAGPKLANMTEFGRTPLYTADQFAAWGYAMVLFPVSSLRVAAKAAEQLFVELRDQGTQKGSLEHMQTRKELYDTIDYQGYEALDEAARDDGDAEP